MAVALVAYGVIGIVLSVAGLLMAARPLATLQSAAGQGGTAGRWLDSAVAALAGVEQSTSGAATSLAAAETATRSAAGLFDQLSSAMAGLRDASGLSVLGLQPLAGMSGELDAVATRAGTLADDMGTLGSSLAGETGNLGRLSSDLAALRAEMSSLRALVGGDGGGGIVDAIGGLTVVALLAALWLTLPALASLAVGLDQLRRLRRGEPRSSLDLASGL